MLLHTKWERCGTVGAHRIVSGKAQGRVYTSSLQLRGGLARVEERKGAATCPPRLLSPLKTSTTRVVPVGSARVSKAQPWPGAALPNQ